MDSRSAIIGSSSTTSTRTGEPSGWDSSGRTFFSSAMDDGLVVLWMRLTGFLTFGKRSMLTRTAHGGGMGASCRAGGAAAGG
ncbi:hypothetical protein GCM10022241_21480 [Micrococcus endophyticus]